MERLTLRLFGGFEAKQNERQLTFPTVKVQALLAYLAVEVNRPHQRERFVEMLWSDYTPQSARANLRNTLRRLRQSLGESLSQGLIESTRKDIRLTHQPRSELSPAMWLDVTEFGHHIQAAQTHPHAHLADCTTCLEHLTQAVTLYRGEFLAGFDLPDAEGFEEWVRMNRATLQRQYRDVVMTLSQLYATQNNFGAAQHFCELWLAAEPWNEQAHQQLIRTYVATGQEAAALQQFQECKRLLAAGEGTSPSPETAALIDSIQPASIQPASIQSESSLDTSIQSASSQQQAHTLTHGTGSGTLSSKTFGSASSELRTIRTAEPEPAAYQSSTRDAANTASEGDAFPLRDEPLSDHAGAAPNPRTALSQLAVLPRTRLFGVDKTCQRVEDVLVDPTAPSLLALEGIGGIGKTSVAIQTLRKLAEDNRFAELLWVSAKQQEFLPESGLQESTEPALDEEMLINEILAQLGETIYLSVPLAEKRLTATQRLRSEPFLVVIDNLETVVDYQALLPAIRQMAHPTQFLLTSRRSLQAHRDVYSLPLSELDYEDALALIRHEGHNRGIDALVAAEDEQLAQIYQVVGGNPLALNLVIGQLQLLPLSNVLDNMQRASSGQVDELYTYIYWQAWQMLDPTSRQLLLMLPLSPNCTFDELAMFSQLHQSEIEQALAQLVELSLVEVGGGLEERTYRIHRLTETFLLHEVMKWQSLTDTFTPEQVSKPALAVS